MILEIDNWFLGYNQILKDCQPDDDGASGAAMILCNADVDAMAAARILSYMFRNDSISYQLLPCMGYKQLAKRITQNKVENLRALVLLNLGASRNLTRLFHGEPYLDPSVKVYVMDCRRPVHLANIHAGNHVVVFWDVQNEEEIPSDGDNLSGNDSSSDEEDDDSEEEDDSLEGENEFDDREMEGETEFGEDNEGIADNPAVPPENDAMDADDKHEPGYEGEDEGESENERKRQKIEHRSDRDEKDEDGDTEMETEDSDPDSEPSTQQPKPPTMTPRELHENRRNRLKLYYASGSYFGSPAAFVAYRVATQLRFEEVGDLLWLACVGVTDAYLHARLDRSGYSTLAMTLQNYCSKLFPNDAYQRITDAVYAEHLVSDGQPAGAGQDLTKIGFSGNGRIVSERDYRFFMLRYTSLFNAMVYSELVSTRLQLSTTKGMHKLRELLARMGFPLRECSQPFPFMKPTLRRSLRKKIEEFGEEYGLENFEFTSFFRVTGYQSLLSASDTSYAVSALLECPTPSTKVTSNTGDIEKEEEEALIKSFNIAFDALNSNAAPTVGLNGLAGEGNNLVSLVNGGNLDGNTGLGSGIRLAMSLQKSIISTASGLIDRNAITRLSHFRYAYVTCTSQGHNEQPAGERSTSGQAMSEEEQEHIFSKPLALTRLAHYLMDLHRENGKWTGTKARPLILLAEKPRTKSYVVVGYEYPESAGDLVKNRFGKNFELAAQSMDGTFLFDSFDSNVVEVVSADSQRFMEQLHYLMDQQ